MKTPTQNPFGKKSPFRPVEEWKSAILTLEDSAYFELLRSVFGNIKTPYNKHKLMEDLTAFLNRKEIQEAVAAYLGPADHRIIAAIVLLEEPEKKELESFFAGEYSPVELHNLLLNLEERFIVYRFRDEGTLRLALNPLFEPLLTPYTADTAPLFPSSQGVPGKAAASPGWDYRVFAALLAFYTGQDEFYKAEGEIRKKVLDEGQRIFPGLNLETLCEGLIRLGLLQIDGFRLNADARKVELFASLSCRERLEYWAAGMYLYAQAEAAAYGHRGRLQITARFFHRLIGALEQDHSYPLTTLKRLAGFISRDEAAQTWTFSTSPVIPPSIPGETGTPPWLAALETAGLLQASSPESWVPAPGIFQAKAGQTEQKPVIAMDTAFSCILYPEIGLEDALLLSSFCAVRDTGAVVRFELNRESAVRGFDRGLNAAAMISCLERLSGGQADQSLRYTLEDWGSRYAAVSLYQGTVLCLSEDRRYLAEAEPLRSRISRTLAPGIYLLPLAEKQGVTETLGRAGVDIVAQPPLVSAPGFGEIRSSFPALGTLRFLDEKGEKSGVPPVPSSRSPLPETAEVYQERFRQALAGLSLSKPERDELAARIERRLILTESQLVGDAVRFEKLEARNLDYMGKTLVAKQAIATKSMVEILQAGGEKHIFGIPESLEKQTGDSVLVLRLFDGSGPLRVPLGKISLLRRIKKSIFGE